MQHHPICARAALIMHAKQGQAPDGVTAHARAHKHSALAGGCLVITTGSYAFVFAFLPGCSATCADIVVSLTFRSRSVTRACAVRGNAQL